MKRISFDLIVEDFGDDCKFSGKAWENNNQEYTVLLCNPEFAESTLIHELMHILQFAGEYAFIEDIMEEIISNNPGFYHSVLDYVREDYGSPVNYLEVEAICIQLYITYLCDNFDEPVRYFDYLSTILVSDYDLMLIPCEVFKSYDSYLDKDVNVSYTLDLNGDD